MMYEFSSISCNLNIGNIEKQSEFGGRGDWVLLPCWQPNPAALEAYEEKAVCPN